MKTQTDKTQQQQHSVTPRVASESSNRGTAQLMDNRTSTTDRQTLQEKMRTSTTSKVRPIQRKKNNTGLPDTLKSGIENLSGYNMDDVKVHYNSSKPAQLQAHAYAQGTDIHLAPGQEKHLPHEAWHVVQQKQGRVKPTMQLKSKVNINDDVRLEKEADVMGDQAKNLNYQLNESRMSSENKGDKENNGLNHSITTTSHGSIVQRVLAQPDINPNFRNEFFNMLTNSLDLQNPQHLQITMDALLLDTNDLDRMYRAALRYIDQTVIGSSILDKIRLWSNRVTIKIGYNLATEALIPDAAARVISTDVEIPWNPLMTFAVWNEDYILQGAPPTLGATVGTMSPAAVLLHEFGHVCQHIDDTQGFDNITSGANTNISLYATSNFEFQGGQNFRNLLEHHNVANHEHPFAAEKNEPVRNMYDNVFIAGDITPPRAGSPIPQVLMPLVNQAVANRWQYIANNGWVNGVTQHTNNQQANRQDRNLDKNLYLDGRNGLTDTTNNLNLMYKSIGHFLDNIDQEIATQTRLQNWDNIDLTRISNIVNNYINPIINQFRAARKRTITDRILWQITLLIINYVDPGPVGILTRLRNTVNNW
ncbi:DUF4157 domain-containing protein [Aquimarina sp. D1M17]|uniref:eCIS core domain-containing protein n=1 Tax=Aquimarina acroporae TaxID=2937283 RepID=UPI0020C0536C|nr:DUF4157 domain-containing protein [Aquimarina acroporae]MCK8521025.1 DUF4157 domain-containing protein [Aquimarina acroporae]